mmetsp:Transcript_13001/g.23124  ORF Transcript_13001/g.23124 Transcript_13001/m.23124 type:complete len:120 (-) Transcript_13001:176-535(-)
MSSNRPRGLRFCPMSNDMLYPIEDKINRQLKFYCKICDYQEVADSRDWRVYVSETVHDEKSKLSQLYDITMDPTLPRTKDCRCPRCDANEAVFISESTEKGMTLIFHCVTCREKWKDEV